MDNNCLMRNFLLDVKNNLNSEKCKWLVLGNESGDLDSVISSLVYSYYKQVKCQSFCVVPVICIPKNNINLRKDIIMWLKDFNIDAATELIFLEDIISLMNDLKFSRDLRISLVDHHKPLQSTFTKLVKEVIDHHELIFEYPADQLDIFNIQKVGSCSTLIASYIIDDKDKLHKDVLLKLLYGAILLDTDCLRIANGRTTDTDIAIVDHIEQVLGFTKKNRIDIHEMLSKAKSDVSGLTLNQKLQRDLKVIEVEWKGSCLKIAIPTVIETDVQDLLLLDDLESQLLVILSELNANGFIILTCGRNTFTRRGYLIFAENQELKHGISKYLFCDSKLKLEQIECNLQPNISAFVENNFLTTRKIFIPIIVNYFTQESDHHYKYQSNNCNIHLHINEIDVNIEGDEGDREGAPYTLSTPRCSCSGSPDTRNSDISLRSLNNRHTLALVDQKRQKHSADIDAIDDDNEEDTDNLIEDDVSPLAFTPENSGVENNDSNDDEIGPLPSLNIKNEIEKVITKRITLPDDTIDDNHNQPKISENQFSCSPQLEGNKNFKIEDVDNWNEKLNYLENEVDKKRQKLETNRFDAIANIIVNDILTNSEKKFQNEILYKEILQKWSNSYSESEKIEFIKNIDSDDTSKFAKLLTTGIIRDCISEFELVSIETNNNAMTNDTDDGEMQSVDDDSSENEENIFVPDPTIPDLEINYNSCPIGTIINKDNSCVANCVNSSGIDVENSSFNLYRRISTNQLDFSEDEKRLFAIANNWCPEDDVIYSDCEKEPDQVEDNEEEIGVMKKVIYPNKEITMNIKL